MKTAYFDCIGGISGDMTLAALLDLGVDREELLRGLRTLALPDWDLAVERRLRCGIDSAGVEVVVGGKPAGSAPLMAPPSDAPLEGARAHSHSHAGSAHSHSHSHSLTHSHEHTPSHQHSPGHERAAPGGSVGQVFVLIEQSDLPKEVKTRSKAVFRALAEAEAAVHGMDPDTVQFHEVGRVDSIVDTVGAVFALHLLGVERLVCSSLPIGHGTVHCDHGRMPNPAPATTRLLIGCPVHSLDVAGETVTPTGVAILVGLGAEFGPLPAMLLEGVGYGAGRADRPVPNVLRVLLGSTAETPADAITVMECNLDDQNPQLYQPVMERLLSEGALDVWVTPILMKKGRPAHQLSILVEEGRREAVTRVVFEETTTLGVRFREMRRTCLERSWIPVATPFGEVRVKSGYYQGRLCTMTPEFEDCLRVARAAGVPVKRVQAAAEAAAWNSNREKAE